MPDTTMAMMLIVALMVFLAGLIRGFTGFGFSIAAVPLLSLVMPPARAVPIVVLLQLVVSLNGLPGALRLCDWRSVRVLALGALIATPVGVWGLAHLPAGPIRLTIAVIVAIAVAVLGRGFRMAVAPTGPGALAFGLASGLFNGVAGMPGPPVIAFYLASPIATAVGRASMIVFFLATSIFALVPLIWLGMVDWLIAGMALWGLPVVWFASWAGARLYHRSPDRHYRVVALGVLTATALLAAVRAVSDLAG